MVHSGSFEQALWMTYNRHLHPEHKIVTRCLVLWLSHKAGKNLTVFKKEKNTFFISKAKNNQPQITSHPRNRMHLNKKN